MVQKPTNILYLHGFASSPGSRKATSLGQRLAPTGVNYVIPDLNQPDFEHLTLTAILAHLDTVVRGLPQGPVGLIGSSFGGLTALHPLASFSLNLLENPTARELMMIAASVGLANNFGALKSLVTKGIQVGHMKMHLLNILNSIDVNEREKKLAVAHFTNRKVSYTSVKKYIDSIRKEAGVERV